MLFVILANRTWKITNPSIRYEIFSADTVTFRWQADGATKYAVTWNGVTETLEPEITEKTYTVLQNGEMEFTLVAYGTNDQEGSVIASSVIDLSALAPTPAPDMMSQQQAQLLLSDVLGLAPDEQHRIAVQIDDGDVQRFMLMPDPWKQESEDALADSVPLETVTPDP